MEARHGEADAEPRRSRNGGEAKNHPSPQPSPSEGVL